MAEIKYKRVRELSEMGRPVIELPDNINFAGREAVQRAMGTYWHIDLCRHRLRVAEDRLKRIRAAKASTFEATTYGNIEDLERQVRERQKELAIVMSGGNPEKDTLADLIEEKPEKKVDDSPKVETKSPFPKRGKKEAVTETDKAEPMSGEQMAYAIKASKKSRAIDKDE